MLAHNAISRLRRPDEPTLLTYHNALYMLSLAIANGFVGAYLLRQGFPLYTVLLMYAGTYFVRYIMRLSVLPVVRRVGFRWGIVLGVVVMSLQFLPLAAAERPVWLMVWIFCRALGEAIYWPCYHAAVAVAGDVERRGRDLGLRAALTAIGNILGPMVGGIMLAHLGALATFLTGFLTMLLAALPMLFCGEFPAGVVPGFGGTLRNADRLGLTAFFIDGWMSAGWLIMWPLVYFIVLGSEYETFGFANAAAGAVGFLVSLIGGMWIDRRRHDGWQLTWVCAGLGLSILLRALASWWNFGGTLANLTGSAMSSAYVPLIMSAMYDRAKRSSNAFQFHLAIEGAWDSGCMIGLLCGAAIAWLAVGPVSLVCLPALPGVLALAATLWRDRRYVTSLAAQGETAGSAIVPGGI